MRKSKREGKGNVPCLWRSGFVLVGLSSPSRCLRLALLSREQSSGSRVISSSRLLGWRFLRAVVFDRLIGRRVRLKRARVQSGKASLHERLEHGGPLIASCTAGDRPLQTLSVPGMKDVWTGECPGSRFPFGRPARECEWIIGVRIRE